MDRKISKFHTRLTGSRHLQFSIPQRHSSIPHLIHFPYPISCAISQVLFYSLMRGNSFSIVNSSISSNEIIRFKSPDISIPYSISLCHIYQRRRQPTHRRQDVRYVWNSLGITTEARQTYDKYNNQHANALLDRLWRSTDKINETKVSCITIHLRIQFYFAPIINNAAIAAAGHNARFPHPCAGQIHQIQQPTPAVPVLYKHGAGLVRWMTGIWCTDYTRSFFTMTQECLIQFLFSNNHMSRSVAITNSTDFYTSWDDSTRVNLCA